MHMYIHVYTCMYICTFVLITMYMLYISVCDETLPVWNIALIAVGVILFIVGVTIGAALVVVLFLRVKSSG